MKRDYGKCYTDRTYLLAAGAYAADDYRKLHLFEDRYLRWGYFPKESTKSLNELIKQKEPMSIIWTGRLIPWKRPLQALVVAKHLKEKHITFHMNIIGNGELENELHMYIAHNDLQNYVNMLGSIPFEEVRRYMERSQIMLFTSNRQEGWGAVLNEAMSSACAVIANNEIGSVPFLLTQKKNGIIYNGNENDLVHCIDGIFDDQETITKYGKCAWDSIHNIWNAKIAANRIISISNSIYRGMGIDLFKDGPCSKIEK